MLRSARQTRRERLAPSTSLVARDERVEIRVQARAGVTLTEVNGVLGLKLAWRLRTMLTGLAPQGTPVFHDWAGFTGCDPDAALVLARMLREEQQRGRSAHVLLAPSLAAAEVVPAHLLICHASRQTWLDALDAAQTS